MPKEVPNRPDLPFFPRTKRLPSIVIAFIRLEGSDPACKRFERLISLSMNSFPTQRAPDRRLINPWGNI